MDGGKARGLRDTILDISHTGQPIASAVKCDAVIRLTGKQEILFELEKRVNDNILERSNFDLLKKLVENADTLDEAIRIAELGTIYKRTGLHFDKRLERQGNTISYFKKNDVLSFETDPKSLTHKLIIGDNYPALHNLLIEYRGNIDVIYIDPPYGKDSLGAFAQTNYDNALTRDNLLSMLYPRLWLAKQLLSETGIIFCSIDDKNQAYVKCLFDEVFGENNFVANVVWENKEGGGGSDSKFFRNKHEYVLVYAKDIEYATINPQPVEDVERYTLSDKHEATRGKYQLIKLDSGSLGWVKSLDFPIELEGKTFYAGGDKVKWEERQRGGAAIQDWGWRWRWSKDKLKWGLENDFVVVKGDNIYTKQYLGVDKDGNLVPRTIQPIGVINKFSTTQSNRLLKELFGKVPFNYTKPVELIRYLLSLATKPHSIVLDFFAGSGTTGHAVLELNASDGGNRQFILCTNNENGIAFDITSKRLKRVMTGECYDGSSDFDWVKKHKPLGDNLEVLDIVDVANFESVAGKTPFDVIDETLYGQQKFKTVKQKIEWVCDHFEGTQKRVVK